MKRLIFLLLLLPVVGFGQIWKGAGISYTRSIPNHNPGTTGAWVAIDTLSGDWYEWQSIGQVWREMGDRIQFSYVSGAPSWIPNKQRSRFVLNAGDSLYVYQGGWVLLNPSAGASYNTSLTYTKPVLSLTDAGGTLTATIPDTSGSNYTMTFSADTLRLTDQSGTLWVRIPTGGGGGSDTSGYNQSLTYINDTLTITDGNGSLSVEIPQPVFPANLVLFATTAADTVATYGKLVTSLDDPNYDDPAVNVTTGIITTNQIVGRQISAFGLIVGNPGVITVQTIGEIRRTSGTGTAEFYFEVYKRESSGVETLLATSNVTPPISSSAYTEFQASALLNNGSWGLTDRIVIKFYANRVVGGSDPTYDFLFGGTNPVRTTFPVPASLLANVPIVVGVTDVNASTPGRYLTTDVNGKLDEGTISAGTGISISGSPDITISNSAPDQTVSISGGGITSVSGTYPNFTITSTEVDGSTTNEIQTIDDFSIVSDSLRLSLSSDGQPYSAVNLGDYKQTLSVSGDSLFISNGNGVQLPPTTIDTATYLTQDTILVYYANGVEFGRDTIRAGGGGLSGGVANYIAQYTSATAIDTTGLIWTGGRLGVAETSPTARVNIKGQGSTSATTALLVENSSDVAKLVVKDDGAIEVGRNASGTTQATASVVVTGSETTIGLALVPKGNGAITADIPDGTIAGGNARGGLAVDFQIARDAASQVASNDYSAIFSGQNNTASGAYSIVLGGAGNTAAGGSNAFTSVVGGLVNSTTATYTFIGGGRNNTASATYSSLIGGFGGNSYMYGQTSRASGAYAGGISTADAQTSDIRLRRSITGTAQTELFLDGASVRAILALPTGATAGRLWNAKIQVVAIVSSVGTADTIVNGSSFIGNYAVGIKRIGNTTSLVGSVQDLHAAQADTGMESSVVSIDADDTNEALRIQFTPPSTSDANTVIRVVATVYLTEVGY